MGLNKCARLDLPKVVDPRGNLTFIENKKHIPFDIKRIFYIYDVAVGAPRGGHAHRELEQFIISISGTFDVVLDDGAQKKRITLSDLHYGLYIPPMIWVDVENFSSGAVCLAFVSAPYDEADYFRDYEIFLKAVQEHSSDSLSTIS